MKKNIELKKVYVVCVNSESGDEYGPFVFEKKPTDLFLKKFLKKECPDEFYSNNCGAWGSALHYEIKDCNIL